MHSQIQIEISLCIGACQRKQKSRFLHCFSSLSFVFFTRIKGKFPWSRISWNGTLLFRLYNTHIINPKNTKTWIKRHILHHFLLEKRHNRTMECQLYVGKITFLYLDEHLGKYCASHFQISLLVISRWEVNAAVAIDVSCRL